MVNSLNESLSIARKNFDNMMEQLKKSAAAGASGQAIKNTFCSASGELLGASRAVRAVVNECSKDINALASIDKSIEETVTAIDGTCK